mmetsp:Transcript_3905/g.14407  ORF Transcript_3905/g.14407 Transcript_3905/m.14407 type:complete len:435 (-) Transcript_3905:69-1373(-)
MKSRSFTDNFPPPAAKKAVAHRAHSPHPRVKTPYPATFPFKRETSTAAPIKPNNNGSPSFAHTKLSNVPVAFAGFGPQLCAAAVDITSDASAAPPENSHRAPANSAVETTAISANARAPAPYPSAIGLFLFSLFSFSSEPPPPASPAPPFVVPGAPFISSISSSSGGSTTPRIFPRTTPKTAPPAICSGARHAAAAAPPAPIPGRNDAAIPKPAMAYTTSTDAAVITSAGTPVVTPKPWSCSWSIDGTTTAGEIPANRKPRAAQYAHGSRSVGLASSATTTASAVAGPNANRLIAHRKRYTALTSRLNPALARTTPSAAVRAALENRASTASPTDCFRPGMLRSRKPAMSCPNSAGMGGNRCTTRPAPKLENSTTNTAKTAPPGPNAGPTARRPAPHHVKSPTSAIESRRASRTCLAVSSGDHIAKVENHGRFT